MGVLDRDRDRKVRLCMDISNVGIVLFFKPILKKTSGPHPLRSGPFAAVIGIEKGAQVCFVTGVSREPGASREPEASGGAWRAGPSSGKKHF